MCFTSRHYCECKPGFTSYQDPALGFRHTCVDVNECDLGTDTCDTASGSRYIQNLSLTH